MVKLKKGKKKKKDDYDDDDDNDTVAVIIEKQEKEVEEEIWYEMHKEQNVHSKIYMVTWIVGSLSMLLAVMTMIFEASSFIIVVAFVWPLLVAPVMMRQRRLLLQHCSLRYYTHRLHVETTRIALHNDMLSDTVTNLEQQVSKLQSIEQQLQSILTSQGMHIDTFQSLLHENQTTIQEIKVSSHTHNNISTTPIRTILFYNIM